MVVTVRDRVAGDLSIQSGFRWTLSGVVKRIYNYCPVSFCCVLATNGIAAKLITYWRFVALKIVKLLTESLDWWYKVHPKLYLITKVRKMNTLLYFEVNLELLKKI